MVSDQQPRIFSLSWYAMLSTKGIIIIIRIFLWVDGPTRGGSVGLSFVKNLNRISANGRLVLVKYMSIRNWFTRLWPQTYPVLHMRDKMCNYIDWFFANRICGRGWRADFGEAYYYPCCHCLHQTFCELKYKIRKRASKLCREMRDIFRRGWMRQKDVQLDRVEL